MVIMYKLLIYNVQYNTKLCIEKINKTNISK